MNNALTVSDLAAIRLAMTEYDCAHFGLRIVDADRPFAEDEVIPASRQWVDGELTGETLPGASCLEVTEKTLAGVAQQLRPYLLNYRRARVMLIGSDVALNGEDEGELIMEDAFCYWHKVVEVSA